MTTIRILAFFLCWLVLTPLTFAHEGIIAELERLLPDVGARQIEDRAEAQERWQSICYELGRPGNESREAVCLAMGKMLSEQRVRPAAKVFILRMLERVGRDEVVPSVAQLLAQQKAGIREAARRALANNPSEEAGKALRERFAKVTTAKEQRAILNAIGFRADPSTVGFLTRVIRQSKGAVAEAAIAALGNIADSDQLLGELRKGKDRDALLRAADQLAKSGQRGPALKIYHSILAETHGPGDAANRLGAFRGVLQYTVDDRAIVDSIRDALVEGEPKPMRQVAAARIRTLSPEGMGHFAEQLHRLPADAQVMALTSIGTRRNSAAMDAVIQLTRSGMPEVQEAAIEALGGIGDASSFDILLPLVKAGGIRADLATNSLKRIRAGKLDQSLIHELESSSDSQLKLVLIEILNARRAESAVPVLLTQAKSDDPNLRQLALSALSRLASAEDVPGMLMAYTKTVGAERDKAEKHIVNTCRRLPEGAAPVVAYFESASHAKKLQLMPVLGRIGGDSALAAIRDALNSGDAKQYDAGVIALSNWPDASVANDLQEVVNTAKDRGQRIRALRALARVAVLGGTDEQKLEYLAFVMNSATRQEERELALDRAKAVRTVDSLKFVLPFIEDDELGERARRTVIDLAHHRGLREPNRDAFEPALKKVMALTTDARLIERIETYLANE